MKTKKSSEFKIGEIVVYPKHGVGEITKIENMEISNIKTSFYVVKMEQSKLIIRVPLEKKDPPPDAEEWQNVKDKFNKHFSEKPGR